jgi:seryl-tRNA synthetase
VINPDFVRNNPQIVKDSQSARGENPALVDEFLKNDQLWRNLTVEVDNLRGEQKSLSKEIGNLKGQQKSTPGPEIDKQLDVLTKKGIELSNNISSLTTKQEEVKKLADKAMSGISNLVHKDAPVGEEKDFEVIETSGKPRDFNAEGIKIKDHVELGEKLKLIDLERGAKVSGSRFLNWH